MAALAAIIAGIAAFILGEWRYGLLSVALGIGLFVTESATRDKHWYPGGLSVLLAATTVGIAAFRAGQWVIAIPAGLVAVAALAVASGDAWMKGAVVIGAAVLTLLILAPVKVMIIAAAAALAIPLLLYAYFSQKEGRLGCLPILGAVGVVIGAAFLWYYVDEHEREANVKRYGAAVFDLCAAPADLPAASSVVSGGKVLFVESGPGNRGKVLDNYASRLPGSFRAHKAAEIADVVCIASNREVYGTGGYTNGASCTRYQLRVNAYLVDTATGSLVATQSFYGSTPSGCPSSTSSGSITRTGNSPSSQAVADWVLSLIRDDTGGGN